MMVKSFCDKCPKPGNCCKKLQLYRGENSQEVTFWLDEGINAVKKWLRDRFLPFKPLDKSGTWKDEKGREYVAYNFFCPKLGTDGRCTIYKKRPQLCRDFNPGESPLCVFTKAGKIRAAHRSDK